ncbi:Oligopeptide transporter [Cinnamomum micranthum f. kanehirae]|uniref:Oligopeptide transporter n=1 Tax=Cinnamomum micranthum f. kanehirae TaxID=337451 RepID=A0A3S3P3P1_9MAGN|nr:Oligopeptide transporter [Cinnamomum micranthum f. kanehirae]
MAIEEKDENSSGEVSVEQIFETQSIPSWREQLTVRAFVVSLILGFFFSFIVMKLNLTVGIIPSLNVSAGMLGYFLVSVYTKVLAKFGMLKHPFTRQENTVIQTCVVATSGIAFSGGFGSYLFGMSDIIAKQTEEANTAQNTKTLQLGWIIGFLFVVSFLGLFSVVPLRKIMIIDHKLIYPSGTATAHLINSFHTPQGAKLVKRQVYALFKCFVCSFLWAFFQWFYTAGDDCGFAAFPTLGLKAYQNKFYFDFSATYVGVGMICPYIVNISLLAGSVLSWGIMWPLIEAKKGDWYSDKLSASNLHGLQGYKVFIGIAMILGDGLYNFCAMLVKTARDVSMNCLQKEATSVLPLAGRPSPNSSVSFDDMRRKEIFVKDQIPTKLAFLGYALLAVASIITVPHIFPQLKWYHILVTYIFAPVLAFCNAYGCGLTDWSLASSYGKLAIILFGAWVGLGNGGVLAGLASCGVMMSIVSTASDLMQDFKTGYLTLASPRAMFISQVIGTAMGCVIGPVVFWIFYKAYNVGVAGSEYPAPYATVYRGIALLGVEGLGSLPKNCLTLCIIFFIAAFLLSAAKDFAKHMKWRVQHFLPSAMAMAIPFFIGSYFSIDMCLGSLILFLWRKFNLRQAEAFAPAVASGMICGEGIWSLPSSILSLAKVKPPICMKFLSRSTNAKVDAFLTG